MIPTFNQSHRMRALLLATGQLTSYGSGAGLDDGSIMAGKIKRYTVLTLGQYAGTTNITINGKTDIHSNNCVEDNETGLMWSRTHSASVGPASNGLLPWTTTGAGVTAEGIFAYIAAANLALLAGYGNNANPMLNWRPPNAEELASLRDMEAPNALPDPVAFPVWSAGSGQFSSTTDPSVITAAMGINFTSGVVNSNTKTLTRLCALVRGIPLA